MKSIVCATLLVIIAAIKVESMQLRPIEEPADGYSADVPPYTNVYRPRAAYKPFPGDAPENTYYKGYESDAMEYDRWKRSDESPELDDESENWMSPSGDAYDSMNEGVE